MVCAAAARAIFKHVLTPSVRSTGGRERTCSGDGADDSDRTRTRQSSSPPLIHVRLTLQHAQHCDTPATRNSKYTAVQR